MLRMRSTLSMILSVVLVTSGFQANAGIFSAFAALGRMGSKLEEAGVAGIRTARGLDGGLVYQLLDNDGNVISQMRLASSKIEYVNQFKPSKVRQYLTYLKGRGAGIIGDTMLRMPSETFTFLTAMGAVQAQNLIFHYNENPGAFTQFLNQQTDPLGQVSFGAFMVANGIVTEPLHMAAETQAARFMIPYLGMSVGTIASNISHEMLTLPHVRACAMDLMKNVSPAQVAQAATVVATGGNALPLITAQNQGSPSDANCDQAFQEFLGIWQPGQMINDWGPSLVALMGSSLISQAGSKVTGVVGGAIMSNMEVQAAMASAKKAAADLGERLAQRAFIASTVDLAITFAPGGLFVKAAEWGFKVANLAGVIYMQQQLEAPVTFFWKNTFDTALELKRADNYLGLAIANKSFYQWTPAKWDMDMILELGKLPELSFKWRQANMDSVLSAHNNWSQFLGNLSSQYRVSRKFYQDFISDMWKKEYKYKKSSPNSVSLMDRPLPLFGVKPDGFTDADQNKFLFNPDAVQTAQMATVEKVVENIKAKPADITGLNPIEQKIYSTIVSGLSSKDANQVGQSLTELGYRLDITSAQSSYSSDDLKALLRPIYDQLGTPLPMTVPGQGYLKLMAQDPNSTIYANDPFQSLIGDYPGATITENLITSMLAGPDIENGGKTIGWNWSGFADSFHPPMIRNAGELHHRQATFAPDVPFATQYSPFGQEVTVDGTAWVDEFALLRQGNVRASILGDENGNKFDEFWSKGPESELITTLANYQDHYDDIVVDLYNKLFSTENAFFNSSNYSNGVLASLEEERSVYLYILDNILSLRQAPKDGKVTPIAGANSSLTGNCKGCATALGDAKVWLKNSQTAWVQSLLKEWTNARILLAGMKTKTVVKPDGQSKFLVTSIVRNQQIEDEVKKLDDLVAAYPLAPDNKLPSGMRALNETEQSIVKVALAGLKSTQQELSKYAQVVNSVSYVEVFTTGDLTKAERQQCLFIEKSATAPGGESCYNPSNSSGAVFK